MFTRPSIRRLLAPALMVALVASAALGQPSVDTRPWSNVSVEQQEQARRLHRAADALRLQGDDEAALAIFQRAITYWDHPGIRFNIALTQRALGRLASAYENLLAAMQYGPLPFTPAQYQRAVELKDELEGQVTELLVVSVESDVRVTVNGKYLFAGAGERRIWVAVGEYQVVGEGRRGRTVSKSLEVQARKPSRVELPRWPVETERVLVSRWAPWKPWAMAGIGASAILVGVPLQWRAQVNTDAFDQQLTSTCDGLGQPCVANPETLSLRNRGRFQNRMAVASFAIGGAMVITGMTLVVLNRPRSIEVPRLVVYPVVDQERAMVAGAWRF